MCIRDSGSFLMMHSELLTSLQEGYKINIILLNNHGYQCIKGLQMANGSKGFGNEFRYRSENTKRLDGHTIPVDFVSYAKSLGAESYYAKDVTELKQALQKTKQATVSTLIEIPVAPDSMSKGYESWWRVGVPEISSEPAVTKAHQHMKEKIKLAKTY